MSFLKKQEKPIPDGKYRIIKIGKDAIYEVLREYIIDNQEDFFDVTDGTKIVTHFEMDWDNGEFICVARNEHGEKERLQYDVDTTKLLLKMKDTTATMFIDERYVEMSEEEINNL